MENEKKFALENVIGYLDCALKTAKKMQKGARFDKTDSLNEDVVTALEFVNRLKYYIEQS